MALKTRDYGAKLRALKKGRACELCGRSRADVPGRKGQMEFAHVKPTKLNGRGRGLKSRYLDVVRNPECYKLVHRCCHAAMDLGSWGK